MCPVVWLKAPVPGAQMIQEMWASPMSADDLGREAQQGVAIRRREVTSEEQSQPTFALWGSWGCCWGRKGSSSAQRKKWP
jgi:hypothetical protein